MNSEDNSYTLKRSCFGEQIAFKAKEAPFTTSSYLKPDPNLINNYEPKNQKVPLSLILLKKVLIW